MSTWNAFYVSGSADDAAVVNAIRESFPKAKIDPGAKYVGVALDPKDCMAPEEKLCALSARLHTDVLWLSNQSTIDAFQFHHWHDGKHLRALVYGCDEEERTWERAEGTPEPWERTAFFDEENLEFALEDAPKKEHAKLKRMWRDGEIAAGNVEPGIDARETAYQVAKFYGLPHYPD